MQNDANGIPQYTAQDVQSATSWVDLLNKGQTALSTTLGPYLNQVRSGRILTAYSFAEQNDLLQAHRTKYNIPASDSSPVFVYRYDLDMLIACGSTWKRISGHAMYHHRLLTKNRNFKAYSQTKINFGTISFTLPAEAEVVMGLSAQVLPSGWSSGYFYCKPSFGNPGPNGIEPYGYWTSQQTNSRMAYFREWSAVAPRGSHWVQFAYEATKDSPETVLGTVWGTVRYSNA